jgi:hypothetical protein
MKPLRQVTLQAFVEFETELDLDDYRLDDIDQRLNRAIKSVLADYYSNGRINKPNMVIPFALDNQ